MRTANFFAGLAALLSVWTLESIRSAPMTFDLAMVFVACAVAAAGCGWLFGYLVAVLVGLMKLLERKVKG